MAHRQIGQERLGLTASRASRSSLDELSGLIDWHQIIALLKVLYASAKGEAAWPPLAMLTRTRPLTGTRRCCCRFGMIRRMSSWPKRWTIARHSGSSAAVSKTEPTPERTAFVRFRKALMSRRFDRSRGNGHLLLCRVH